MFTVRSGTLIFAWGDCLLFGVEERTGLILCLEGLENDISGNGLRVFEQCDTLQLNRSCTVSLKFALLQTTQCQQKLSSEPLSTSYVLLSMLWQGL